MTNKTIFWLLLSYVLLQLASLFLGNALLLFAYVIVYLTAIFYTVTKCVKTITAMGSSKVVIISLMMFLLANLLLFLVYLPTLIFNPNINWRLRGEVEVDPMLLQAYVPAVLFGIASIAICLSSIIAKFVANRKSKNKTHF
jgi:hypothetical protein